MTALDDGAPAGLDHRGVGYTDRAALVAFAVPLITRALAHGEPVVAVVDRATARELDDALAHTADVRTTDAPPITFPSPSALGGHGSPAFTASLAAWVTGPARVLVLTQYAAGTGGAPSGVDPSLADLPVTLVCACPHDADPEVRRAFHQQHPTLVAERPDADDPAGTALETDLADTADLAGVRRGVRRAAVAAGFRGDELDRTVLAVHEACALGYRLLTEPGGEDAADPATADRRCWVTVRTGDGHLSADVVVPGGAGTDVAGPHGEDQDTVLGRVGLFCRTISVQDGARSRAIRVLAHVGG